MSAYVWWYIVRFYGPIDEQGNVTKRGYLMSQYSKFVRPGFYRISAQANPQTNLYVTAYKSAAPVSNNNSQFVIVALNVGSSPTDQTFTLQDIASGTATVTPYVTSKTKNCEQQNDINVSNGTFTATLEDSSVTTFVGNVVTGVDAVRTVPRTFELYQNYPNPFNPTTEIRYDVAERLFVSIAVYDMLGRKVATLVSQVRDPGQYEITFDAGAFPSGVYFYRLQTAGQHITRKMLLLK